MLSFGNAQCHFYHYLGFAQNHHKGLSTRCEEAARWKHKALFQHALGIFLLSSWIWYPLPKAACMLLGKTSNVPFRRRQVYLCFCEGTIQASKGVKAHENGERWSHWVVRTYDNQGQGKEDIDALPGIRSNQRKANGIYNIPIAKMLLTSGVTPQTPLGSAAC